MGKFFNFGDYLTPIARVWGNGNRITVPATKREPEKAGKKTGLSENKEVEAAPAPGKNETQSSGKNRQP
jgi:hypothetical protein